MHEIYNKYSELFENEKQLDIKHKLNVIRNSEFKQKIGEHKKLFFDYLEFIIKPNIKYEFKIKENKFKIVDNTLFEYEDYCKKWAKCDYIYTTLYNDITNSIFDYLTDEGKELKKLIFDN
jgi:hypothetical protein